MGGEDREMGRGLGVRVGVGSANGRPIDGQH